MKRLFSLALVLVCTAAAAGYPASAGYVNDLTGTLPTAVQDALELRLRAFEHATSSEVAVAIVPSLQGETVEEYARGLFRSWGLGKQVANNGVLFLWAPAERKVRIQVGYGLERILTDRVCAEILSRVTPLFRDGSYSEGVRNAVDGILDRLGAAAPPVRTESPRPAMPALPVTLLVAAVAGLAVLLLTMHHHTTRTHALQREVPDAIARCQTQLQDAASNLLRAGTELAELREQSPAEVWRPVQTALDEAPADLLALRRELDRIHAQRREEYRELTSAARALRRWQRSFEKQTAVFTILHNGLEQVAEARDASLDRIPKLPAAFARAEAQTAGSKQKVQCQEFLDAAQATFDQVRDLRRNPPVNWLLVSDLLDDTQVCLDRIAALDKARSGVPHPPRCWPGSDKLSPAHRLMVGFSAQRNNQSY